MAILNYLRYERYDEYISYCDDILSSEGCSRTNICNFINLIACISSNHDNNHKLLVSEQYYHMTTDWRNWLKKNDTQMLYTTWMGSFLGIGQNEKECLFKEPEEKQVLCAFSDSNADLVIKKFSTGENIPLIDNIGRFIKLLTYFGFAPCNLKVLITNLKTLGFDPRAPDNRYAFQYRKEQNALEWAGGGGDYSSLRYKRFLYDGTLPTGNPYYVLLITPHGEIISPTEDETWYDAIRRTVIPEEDRYRRIRAEYGNKTPITDEEHALSVENFIRKVYNSYTNFMIGEPTEYIKIAIEGGPYQTHRIPDRWSKQIELDSFDIDKIGHIEFDEKQKNAPITWVDKNKKPLAIASWYLPFSNRSPCKLLYKEKDTLPQNIYDTVIKIQQEHSYNGTWVRDFYRKLCSKIDIFTQNVANISSNVNFEILNINAELNFELSKYGKKFENAIQFIIWKLPKYEYFDLDFSLKKTITQNEWGITIHNELPHKGLPTIDSHNFKIELGNGVNVQCNMFPTWSQTFTPLFDKEGNAINRDILTLLPAIPSTY